MTSGQGLEPEQAWEDPPLAPSPFGSDPTTASIGFAPGQPAGSASPLTWAQAQYARLALDLSSGRNLETPGIVTDRYVTHGMPGTLAVTVTSPANGASVDGSTVTVTGTTVPGATVAAQADGPAGGSAGTASTNADSGGHWTLALPTTFGSSTITITATLGRRTGYAQLSVTNVALPGSVVLTAADPSGDDNGPGTYAYPTDRPSRPERLTSSACRSTRPPPTSTSRPRSATWRQPSVPISAHSCSTSTSVTRRRSVIPRPPRFRSATTRSRRRTRGVSAWRRRASRPWCGRTRRARPWATAS
jgi:hypothetical protein